jgi:two-component system heavy metal sensor histidine kinase CusS
VFKILTSLRLGTRSIVGRLTLWYIFSAFILVLLSTSYLYWSLTQALLEEDHAALEWRIHTLHSIMRRAVDPAGAMRRRIETEWSSQDYQRVFVQLLEDQNKVRFQSPAIPPEVIQEVFPRGSTFKETRGRVRGAKIKTLAGRSYMTLTDEIDPVSNPLRIKKIDLAIDLSNEQKVLNHYQTTLVLVLVLALFFCTLIGAQISELGFKPVKDMIEIAGRIRSSTLHERISRESLPLELEALANTLNAMFDRLESSFERLSRFSTDISHELRTPVNNLRGEIEVTLTKSRTIEEYQDVLQSSLEESVRISRIIDSLLFLARAESPETQITKETIDLQHEIKAIVEFYEPTATEEGITIHTSLLENVHVQVERTLFQRAIGNILANAINYTPRGGKISISDIESVQSVEILISDTGKGIDEAHLALIFDRFYREDPSRTTTKLGGFGLGLTIVKSILKLHGGDIRVKSQLNFGTEVCLSFPRSSSI